MKCVAKLIERNFPTLGHSGHGMQIVRIFGDEPFEERGEDIELRQAGDDVRIKLGHIGA